MTIEKVLAKKTYKEDGSGVERRVFYALIGEEGTPQREKLHAHRNSKAIAMLFKTLRAESLLTDAEIDAMLLEVVL